MSVSRRTRNRLSTLSNQDIQRLATNISTTESTTASCSSPAASDNLTTSAFFPVSSASTSSSQLFVSEFSTTRLAHQFRATSRPSIPSALIRASSPSCSPFVDRLPINNRLLHIIRQALATPSFDNIMFWAACFTTFSGFFMSGIEFTCAGAFDPSTHLSLADVTFIDNHYCLCLKSSKCDHSIAK